jgi:hypothetical protein
VVPLSARFALLAAVALTLFAAIVTSYVDDSLTMPILIGGLAIGLLIATILTLRSRP